MDVLESSFSNLFSLRSDQDAVTDITVLTPIQQYAVILKTVKEADIKKLDEILSKSNLTVLQLSELLIHASVVEDYRLAATLIQRGARVDHDNHRAWHLALQCDNKSTIEFMRNHRAKKCGTNNTLYVVA